MLQKNNKILLVDDDKEFTALLSEHLSRDGFNVSVAHDGKEALVLIDEDDYHLCILDVMMPRLNGIETLKVIHQKYPAMPVIMLTAKSEPIDRVVGLELGADDYVSKPAEPHELSARIKAVLRRTYKTFDDNEESQNDKIDWDDNKRLFYIHGEEVLLTGIEYEVLKVLATNLGEVVSKEEISEIALQRTLKPFDRSLDVHISNIRKKISELGITIKSVRGRGYQLIL